MPPATTRGKRTNSWRHQGHGVPLPMGMAELAIASFVNSGLEPPYLALAKPSLALGLPGAAVIRTGVPILTVGCPRCPILGTRAYRTHLALSTTRVCDP